MSTPLIAALVLVVLSVIGTLIALALERGDTPPDRGPNPLLVQDDEGPLPMRRVQELPPELSEWERKHVWATVPFDDEGRPLLHRAMRPLPPIQLSEHRFPKFTEN